MQAKLVIRGFIEDAVQPCSESDSEGEFWRTLSDGGLGADVNPSARKVARYKGPGRNAMAKIGRLVRLSIP